MYGVLSIFLSIEFEMFMLWQPYFVSTDFFINCFQNWLYLLSNSTKLHNTCFLGCSAFLSIVPEYAYTNILFCLYVRLFHLCRHHTGDIKVDEELQCYRFDLKDSLLTTNNSLPSFTSFFTDLCCLIICI